MYPDRLIILEESFDRECLGVKGIGVFGEREFANIRENAAWIGVEEKRGLGGS
jgi:hypothetical protein